mgnify:CR=1 FL=1
MGERSKLTTLCYIEKGDSYLMLHRVSKKHDVNKEQVESASEVILKKMKVQKNACSGKQKRRPGLHLHPGNSGGSLLLFPKAGIRSICVYIQLMDMREKSFPAMKGYWNGSEKKTC